MMKFINFCKRFYLAILLIFIYLPIFVLMIFSFNSGKSMVKWNGFTLSWYQKLFTNPLILNSIWVTVSIAVISSIVATVVGTLAAIGINDFKKLSKSLVINITQIPMVNADIVTGISLLLFFIFLKIPRGYGTMLVSHIMFNIPYVIFSVMPRLRGMDKNLYEAALDMGATPAYAIRKVIIPQLMPGIVSGFIMAFTMSFDDFVISFFASQGIVSNLSIYIYSMAKVGINPEINALSTIMFIIVVTLLVIINIRSIRQQNVRQARIKK
ncbi:MAG: ABC transporter permease [Clostridia bacterium]|nr:ABC transporter permease [Clostridia bacterium]MBR6136177.1 ABC transporter permease [Clostridia bacterium]